MVCTSIVSKDEHWTAPEWMARNLAAHLDPSFVLAKTRVEERFSRLLAGRTGIVDLSTASAAEMRELLRVAESARGCVKRPSEWADPESAFEFIAGYDKFLEALRRDSRVVTVHS